MSCALFSSVFCSLTARGRLWRGGAGSVEGTQCRKRPTGDWLTAARKKKSKKKQQKQLKTTHRENILNTCISFYSFLSAPMCSSVCVCVFSKEFSDCCWLVVVVAAVTHHTNTKSIYVCGLQMFCNKNTKITHPKWEKRDLRKADWAKDPQLINQKFKK